MDQYNETGMVICQECGKPFNAITVQHLNKSHNMSIVEYKQKYEGFPLVSQGFSAKQRLKGVKLFKESPDIIVDEIKDEPIEITQEIKIEDCDDFDLDKIPIIPKDFTESVSNFIEEVKQFTNENKLEFPDPNNIIHKDKLKILNFLLSYFHDIKNSYYIEKTNISGHLEYRLITDICIPKEKLNIEFPNTFWHNMDVPKRNRDSILKNDGWIIIDIPGAKPSISDIKNILKDLKLI